MIDLVLFAGVALFFGFQLWRVLGRRSGDERPPEVPRSWRRPDAAASVVTPMPRQPTAKPVIQSQPIPPDPVREGLEAITKADPSFRAQEFVAGARHAFEIIIQAFAQGDGATLGSLVSPEVLGTFEAVIQQRQAANQKAEMTLERQEEPVIVDAGVSGRVAQITVKFVTDQISLVRAADGSVLEGDPERAEEHVDLWTFQRDTARKNDPNWTLVGTAVPA